MEKWKKIGNFLEKFNNLTIWINVGKKIEKNFFSKISEKEIIEKKFMNKFSKKKIWEKNFLLEKKLKIKVIEKVKKKIRKKIQSCPKTP